MFKSLFRKKAPVETLPPPPLQTPESLGLDPGVVDDLAERYGVLPVDLSQPHYLSLNVSGRENIYPLRLIFLAALTDIRNGRQETT